MHIVKKSVSELNADPDMILHRIYVEKQCGQKKGALRNKSED
jgi:hypothetical protein